MVTFMTASHKESKTDSPIKTIRLNLSTHDPKFADIIAMSKPVDFVFFNQHRRTIYR